MDPPRGEPSAGRPADVAAEIVADKDDLGARHRECTHRLVKELTRGLDAAGIRRKDGDDEEIEHTGAPELLEPEVLPGQDVGDQAEGVGASQASQRYRVGVRDLAALMPGDNVLEQLQLSLVEPLRLRQCSKRIENSRERIAPCGIVVDPFHNLVASGNGCLDHFRREPRSAEGTVRSSVVLVRAEAVPTEHEGSVHVEEHSAKAGEDVGCRHARGWLSGSSNRYQWTRLGRSCASPLTYPATPPHGSMSSYARSCA